MDKKKKTRLLIAVCAMLFMILVYFLFAIFVLKIPIFWKKTITGKGTVGIVSVTIVPVCTFYIGPGWSLLSLCANATNKSVDGVFQNISYRYVMRWNTTRMEYDIYSPRAVNNPFDSLDVNESYFVLDYSSEIFSVFGPPNSDMDIAMVQGWDAPSWPYLFETNVTKYIDSAKHRYMMKWDLPGQEFDIYSPRAAQNPFTKIYKGEGQFIYAYLNHTLQYNKTYLFDP
ncbi:MAG: hypothetical protein IB618_00455 [Candidatus Pacearchaeota archaeon]|nr:MAG: hypothetical protein IB618_00455 [Candidatus Pacearchaeota archaeon]